MNQALKNIARKGIAYFGVDIVRIDTIQRFQQRSQTLDQKNRDLELLQRLNGDYAEHLLEGYKYSRSQLRQDLFVLSHLGFKRDGYFVEFGATNGVALSNTHMLEKEFGWTGILAEPATCWHDQLKAERSCHIDTDCVWKNSNSILEFNQVDLAELSTIESFSSSDFHSVARQKGTSYKVNTISLTDLLRKYDAPKVIDYLSIDTEGSEFEILSHFDFAQFSFEVITCEHNYTPMRASIHALLTEHGYQRVLEDLSLWDDWYVKGRA